MMRDNRIHSKASADSGFGGYSESSNNSMGQPPSFTENNQNDSRASERAEVLKKHEFTITEELRHGISGRVFLVKNPDEDYFVVKEINYRDNMNFNLDAAKKEISILKKLHHGYIVGYVDSFEESGYFYIVSEYCAGGDLYKKMKTQENTPFEEEQILDWFVQICLALQYLHEKNILHRDIKPQNVFLTEDGYINLGDVGCSKVLQSADEYATSVVGTKDYISPEIYENIRHNSKSDIWSLGWLLHDLCMLDVWSNSNMIERHCLHANSLKGTIPTISNMYSKDLKELFRQMLSCDPHTRPSADEILAKPFLEAAVKRNRRIGRRSLSSINPYRNLNLELERSIEELKSCDRNLQTLSDKIKELDDTIDELESMHKAATVGSLVGASVAAAGVITSITGVCLAPFTFGASLALTVGGVVAGAGGVTSAASNITKRIRQKTMCKNIAKIIIDILTTIHSMVELMDTIYNITENNELEKTTILKVAGVATVAEIGQICAEAAKEICVYVNAVIAVLESISAAKAVSGSALAAKAGELVAALLAGHVYSIVKDSIELSEMNQPAGKRKEEEISSEMLKFILQMKAVADQFKKIVEIFKDAKDTIDTKWC